MFICVGEKKKTLNVSKTEEIASHIVGVRKQPGLSKAL